MIEEFDYNNSFYSIKECKNFLNNEASNINNAKNEGMLTACFHYIEEYEKKLKEEYLDKLEPLFSVKCIDDSFLGDAMIFKPVAEGSVYNVYKKDDEKNSYVIKDDNNNLTSVPKHFFKMEEGSPKKYVQKMIDC